MGERIESFRDLKVYKLAFELQQQVFDLTRRFPQEERYALSDQIRRSSRSVGANISEAWQKRRYAAHFVSRLSDADGEQAETQHWLASSIACGYISVEQNKGSIGYVRKKVTNSPNYYTYLRMSLLCSLNYQAGIMPYRSTTTSSRGKQPVFWGCWQEITLPALECFNTKDTCQD